MRYQGKITNWKDEQGFGFVTPNGGGEKAFVHISEFSGRSRRPFEGDLITYQLAIDEQRRFQANDIRLVGEQRREAWSLSSVFTFFFCSFLVLSVLFGKLHFVVLGFYIVASIVTYFIYSADKSAAKNGARRTPEKKLHLLGMMGGWPGAVLAQKILRHKSVKQSFQHGFWVRVAINCVGFGGLFTENGATFLNSLIKIAMRLID